MNVELLPSRGYIRTATGRLSGACQFDRHTKSDVVHLGDRMRVQFLALSIVGDSLAVDLSNSVKGGRSISHNYGCPCSIESESSSPLDHIVECPEHSDFHKLDYVLEDGEDLSEYAHYDKMKHESEKPPDTEQIALYRHLMKQGYRDKHERLLHHYISPPMVNVMVIGVKKDCGTEGKIFQRLGTGQMDLKRWVEACPNFETIVLE